ncbi:MAG: hypothetical protein R3B91_22410 [Planctomycetaceae bacterium]
MQGRTHEPCLVVDFVFEQDRQLSSAEDPLDRRVHLECIALSWNRRITSEDVVGVLVDLFAIRGVPEFVRCDNGPEFIGDCLNLPDRIEVGTSYIEPGSPLGERLCESFTAG